MSSREEMGHWERYVGARSVPQLEPCCIYNVGVWRRPLDLIPVLSASHTMPTSNLFFGWTSVYSREGISRPMLEPLSSFDILRSIRPFKISVLCSSPDPSVDLLRSSRTKDIITKGIIRRITRVIPS